MTTYTKNHKNYYQKNRQKIITKNKKREKQYKWIRFIKNARQRCNNPNSQRYNSYGDKGIKCFLTYPNGKYLWFRDKAYLMKRPSLHRKNNKKNYIINNCVFIEYEKHMKLRPKLTEKELIKKIKKWKEYKKNCKKKRITLREFNKLFNF